jgi:hypothetical protein
MMNYWKPYEKKLKNKKYLIVTPSVQQHRAQILNCFI